MTGSRLRQETLGDQGEGLLADITGVTAIGRQPATMLACGSQRRNSPTPEGGANGREQLSEILRSCPFCVASNCSITSYRDSTPAAKLSCPNDL